MYLCSKLCPHALEFHLVPRAHYSVVCLVVGVRDTTVVVAVWLFVVLLCHKIVPGWGAIPGILTVCDTAAAVPY